MLVFKLTDEGPKPTLCAYSAHMGGHWLKWSDVEKVDDGGQRVPEGTHPVVYVANGSHANYFHGSGLFLTAPPLVSMAASMLRESRRLVDYTISFEGGARHLAEAKLIPPPQNGQWTGDWRWLNQKKGWGSPGEFLDLVMELRESDASAHTLQDTPIFSCIQMSLWDVLDSLGGASVAEMMAELERDEEGYTVVAKLSDFPPGTTKRVYNGSDAIALFNVDGTFHAVSDRCTHGRASLSEGSVNSDGCTLTCPWHGGQFNIKTGEPLAGPVRVPLKTYKVKIEGDRILVG